MRRHALAIALAISVSACVFNSEPKNNQDFSELTRIAELAGVYKNKGDPSRYLSEIIWGDKITSAETKHKDIDLIEVTSTENALTVKAIKNGCAIYQEPYIVGRDFKIRNGKIIIHRDVALLTRGGGDVLMGPSYDEVALGLDKGGQGKHRSAGFAAGLVFMIFPVAFADTSDTRFERVKEGSPGFKACGIPYDGDQRIKGPRINRWPGSIYFG